MKKNRLLKLVSSICGVVAICGVFGLSLFSKNVEETSAVTFEIDHRYFNNTIYYTGNYQRNLAIGNPNSPPPTPLYRFTETENGSTTIYFNGASYLLRDTVDNVNTYTYVYDVSLTMFANSYVDTAMVLRDLSFDGSNNFRVNIAGFDTKYLNVSLRLNTLYFTPVDSNRYTATIKFDLFELDTNTLLRSVSNTYYINQEFTLPSYDSVRYNMEFNHAFYDSDVIDYASSFSLQDSYFADITDGSVESFDVGYQNGYTDGYNSGLNDGYNSGYKTGYDDGVASQQYLLDRYYNNGYENGFSDGINSNGTAVTVFSGILQIGLLPINFFLSILNFEILGINLSAFIKAILTVCLTVIVIKTILGNGGGGA